MHLHTPRLLRPLAFLLAWAFSGNGMAASAGDAPGTDPGWEAGNVRVELIAEVDTIVPGEPFWVALRQEIRPGWHTYWRNPGDSGAPTTISFDLPPGFSASDIHWPVPERLAYGPLMNFGYKDEVVLPVMITPPATIDAGSISLAASAKWLVCADICIPEEGDMSMSLPVGPSSAPSADAPLFDEVRTQIPQTIGLAARQTNLDGQVRLEIDIPGLSDHRIENVTFFPFAEGAMENPSPQPWSLTDTGIAIEVEQGWDFTPETVFDGVLVIEEDSGERLVSAFEIQPTLTGAGSRSSEPVVGLATALAFAFLGGLILNLMPCVFPVLSIKILSLMNQVGAHSSRIRLHGWVYLAGVVLSFVAVAVVLIALRAGGAQIGWGFQLQSPMVVGLLAYLFFLIGLNLFGFFELGTSIMNLGQERADQEGLTGSFLTGVLATVVAAPCTVPFMATAVGFALTQSNLIALTTFAALGLGMAAPYVLLCYSPAAMDRLPRPGPWMARFRELLAFPMFATAIWLVWVLSQQTGPSGMVMIGGGALLLTFAIWLGKHVTASVGFTAAAVLIVSALYLPAVLDRSTPAASSAGGAQKSAPPASYRGPVWDAWSPARVDELRDTGPVFVNFTAAWCITCKVNEAVALDSEAVRKAFEARGVSYLKGDWTNEDPDITRALEEYGRSGVPLYLLYKPGEGRAEVLPQVLTESTVLRALESL